MTLKKKSIIVSTLVALFFVIVMVGVIYEMMTVNFQEIENQRVERNVRRISAILDDKLNQINAKLADWTIWDDTYEFLTDKNENYIKTNLTPESFVSTGVNEVIFIDKSGKLVTSLLVNEEEKKETDFPKDVYSFFKPGSELLEINKEKGFNSGLVKTDDGLLMFVIREVVKSDGTGNPNGWVVFGRYLDKEILNSFKNLTQFEAEVYMWNDTNLPADFVEVKNKALEGNHERIKIRSESEISGYLIIDDIFGEPQAIVRTDILRDITTQGKTTMVILILSMTITMIFMIGINYWLMTASVLKKVSIIASDVNDLGKNAKASERLTESNKGNDEVDSLRKDINRMLDSLNVERQKGDSLIDLINTLVVMLDKDGRVVMINKKGLDLLSYTKEELLNKNWLEVCIPDKSRPVVRQIFEEIMSGNIKDNTEIESEVITKNDKLLMISWKNTVITDNDGKVISTLSLGEDITIKKEEQKKKDDYAKELEKLNELMVDRELKMISLKKELDEIKKRK